MKKLITLSFVLLSTASLFAQRDSAEAANQVNTEEQVNESFLISPTNPPQESTLISLTGDGTFVINGNSSQGNERENENSQSTDSSTTNGSLGNSENIIQSPFEQFINDPNLLTTTSEETIKPITYEFNCTEECGIDGILDYEIANQDVVVESLVSGDEPFGIGWHEITVRLQNDSYGTQTVNTIDLSINGVALEDYHADDLTIPAGSSYDLVVGIFNFESAGTYDLLVHCTMLNGFDQMFSEDRALQTTIEIVDDSGMGKSSIHSEESTLTSSTIHCWPNPSQEFLQVQMDADSEQDLQIVNAVGTVIAQYSFNSEIRIDVSQLSTGMYFLRINDSKGEEKKIKTKRFIVSR